MLRIALVLIGLTSSAAAQIMTPDDSLQQQLVPDSFTFDATAVATKVNLFEWITTISYSVVNKSGMNLYMGLAIGSVSIGSCSRARRAFGGLQFLPPPGMTTYSFDVTGGEPRAIFATAGARIPVLSPSMNATRPIPASPPRPSP